MCLHPQPTSGAGTDFPAGRRGPFVSARGQDFTWPSCRERPPRQAEPSAHTHGLVGPQEGNPRPREGRPVAQGHTAGTSRVASEFQQSVCQGNPPGPCTPCGAGSSGQVGGPSPGSCARTLPFAGERREGVNASVSSDVQSVFKGKTYSQLQVIFQGIEGKIRAGGPNLDMGYWESLLQQLRAHMARAR